MSDQKNKNTQEEIETRLVLFEGIIIGIYGNWLVSLIQMISFASVLIILQSILTLISLASLVALLAIGIFGSRLESRIEVVILSCGHFLPICANSNDRKTFDSRRLFFNDRRDFIRYDLLCGI